MEQKIDISLEEILKLQQTLTQAIIERDQLRAELVRYQDMVSALLDEFKGQEELDKIIEILKQFMC